MSGSIKLHAYDPRDPTQSLEDPATWKETDNAALIMAVPMIRSGLELADDFRERLAVNANYCDERVGLSWVRVDIEITLER